VTLVVQCVGLQRTTYTCYMYCCHNTGIELQDFKYSVLNNSVTLTRYRPTP